MKKGFLSFVFLLSLCLVACSTKIPPIEERLSLTESSVQRTESSMAQESVEVTENWEAQTKNILQVQTDTKMGSGVLWDRQGEEWIVVTAAHVVEGLQEAEVYLVQEDKILPARVRDVRGLDLAFLVVSVASLNEQVERAYSPVRHMKDNIEEGTIIYTKGYNPYGELCEFSGKVLDDWMYVEDFDNYMIICDCQATPGMSGGAVVTENGGLAGLICGENDKGILAVLPVGIIQNEYELFQKN
ncbi:MAG: trypsin-like peptidase domain-containing protein [Lachnospiraceae bacterium]|nr:trypsin-like peptidase domain-containing protein [Lachnospiraceae bacterium]